MLSQINLDSWEKGDYRCCIQIYRSAYNLLNNYDVNFEVYNSEGLGEVIRAFFKTSKNRQFVVSQVLGTKFCSTDIHLLYDQKTLAEDVCEILNLLNLKYSDLDWIDPEVFNSMKNNLLS